MEFIRSVFQSLFESNRHSPDMADEEVSAHQRKSWARLRRNATLIRWLNTQHAIFGLRRAKYRYEHQLIERHCQHLFDEEYYLRHNPDVATYPGGALAHFVRYGARENRNPHPLFDIAYYCAQFKRYPKNVNPLVHFHLLGRRNAISPTRWFSYARYLDCNFDVRAAKIEPFMHYVKYGVIENRLASDRFDALQYIARYSDVQRSGLPALYHFIEYGVYEGRVPVFGTTPAAVSEQTSVRSLVYNAEEERADALRSILEIEPKRIETAAVDVIVPVYRDYYLTLSCIRNAIKMKNQTGFEIIVIDDKSPEPELTTALERIAAKGLITLVRHGENRGFVKSVNEGMRLHWERDVILLNSDAEVYGDWIDRLRRIAYNNPSIATVTPLTNNGTICSYPHFCRDNAVPPDIDIESLDRIASVANAGAYVVAPTAVGFCMYIKREALHDVGLFDEESFGTGYGEENDFCLRARRRGWKDVLAMDVVVQHHGSASFRGERGTRVKNALKVIGQRYPEYENSVHQFIAADPVHPFRSRLDHERLVRLSGAKNMLIVSHSRGGGTEQHIQERASRYAEQGWSIFRLSADPGNRRLARLSHQKALDVPNVCTFDLGDYGGRMRLIRILREIAIDEMEIHHLGDFWASAPRNFVALAEMAAIPYRFVAHDYLSICPRINLADATGLYCGEPVAEQCNTCLRRHGSDYGQPDIEGWREDYGRLLIGADHVIVPNADVKVRLNRYFPDVRISVEPHDDVRQAPFKPRQRKSGEEVRIGTIGAISPIKGLDVLRACARHARSRKLPVEYVVVGYTSDDVESRKAGLKITGPYANDHVTEIVEKAELDAIFIASTCPETYSYTLSLAFKTGLPVIAFDIGAVAHRLRSEPAPNLLLPIGMSNQPSCIVQRHLQAFDTAPVVTGATMLTPPYDGDVPGRGVAG